MLYDQLGGGDSDRPDDPDAVLLDWNMPVMDGFDFLKELRKLPGGKDPKVVFCTTENDVAHIARALHAGATRHRCREWSVHDDALGTVFRLSHRDQLEARLGELDRARRPRQEAPRGGEIDPIRDSARARLRGAFSLGRLETRSPRRHDVAPDQPARLPRLLPGSLGTVSDARSRAPGEVGDPFVLLDSRQPSGRRFRSLTPGGPPGRH